MVAASVHRVQDIAIAVSSTLDNLRESIHKHLFMRTSTQFQLGIAVSPPPYAYPSEVAPFGANHRATGEVAPLPSTRRCCFIRKQLNAARSQNIRNEVLQHLRDVAQRHGVPGADWCGVEGCLGRMMKTTGTTNNALWKRPLEHGKVTFQIRGFLCRWTQHDNVVNEPGR